MVFKKLFSRKNKPKPKAPEGSVIYAVGDIHGRFDLLEKMHDKILADAENHKDKRKVIIYLGDYVDRGMESCEVINCLIKNPLVDFERHYIKGNHEHAMQRFLEEPESSEIWLFWGGEATLFSYGVDIRDKNNKRPHPTKIAEDFANKLPFSHKNFLDNLKMYHEEGDYLFVHAGLRPGKKIDEQADEDMMMIREEFIFSNYLFDKTVIFGHTIFSEPFISNGRIGIDTGSYASGKLTSVVLEGEDVRFISVS